MANLPIGMILSAGFGTRMHPLSLIRPKPLMELAGKPIIYFLIRMLEKAGVKDIILNLHYHPGEIGRMIRSYDFKARIHLVYEKHILGTGGGVAHALQRLDVKNRALIVLHGDIICDFDLGPLMAANDFCTLICDKDRKIAGYRGSVGADDKGHIVELGQFFTSGLPAARRGFFTGIQFLSPSAVKLVRESSGFSLVAEIYPAWLREGRLINGIIQPLLYDDLGTKACLFRANMALLEDFSSFRFVNMFEGLQLRQGMMISPQSEIHPDARLVSPLIISKHVQIKKHAQVGPHVSIGPHATISEGAVVKNAVVMAHTTIEKDEHVDCALTLRNARVLVKTTG
jgi:NDP-sugar pyrophosphorylase family protein